MPLPLTSTALRRWRKLCSLGLLGGASVGALVAGCRGPDLAYDCDVQRTAFYEAAVQESFLKGWVPNEGPYAMSLTITEQGINDLLNGILDDNIPFAGELSTGVLNVVFEPEEVPDIVFVEDEDCDNCVLYTVKFAVDAISGGGPIATGLGGAQMKIPLLLDKKNENTTVLSADYANLELVKLDLDILGFNSEEYTSLAGALTILLEDELQQRFSKSELFELGSWNLGEGEVELLARELQTFPNKGTMSIGLASNLEIGDSRGFELDGEVPEGVEFGIRVDNEVFTQITKRMLSEGEIPRLYNEDGNPDPNGNYGATFVGIEGQDDDLARLETRFRIWRIDFGYCGYAEVGMPLDFAVESGENDFGIETGTVTVTTGDISVVRGAGVGSVAARDDELVEQQEPLLDVFKTELVDTVSQTLNYDALDVEGSNILFVPVDVRVDASSVYLDSTFTVFAAPDDGN